MFPLHVTLQLFAAVAAKGSFKPGDLRAECNHTVQASPIPQTAGKITLGIGLRAEKEQYIRIQ